MRSDIERLVDQTKHLKFGRLAAISRAVQEYVNKAERS
jgi:hypothetical protein